jgi:hypothetical protein
VAVEKVFERPSVTGLGRGDQGGIVVAVDRVSVVSR